MRGVVTVLGAGVVGLSTAWALVEDGWQVRLIDRQGVGLGTSLRNGGQLSYRYVAPLADAGVPFKALRWLTQADGPLRWRPGARWHDWRWLGRFLSLCNGTDNQATARRLARLGQYSRDTLATWMDRDALGGFDWSESGKLVVYRSAAGWSKAARSCAPSQRVLNAQECLALEPALATVAPQLAGGIHSVDEAVADCHAFCVRLAERLAQHPQFLGLEQDTVQQLRPHTVAGRRRWTVQGAAQPWHSDAVVLAAGIASRTLAQPLGLDLPLLALKGYSLDVPVLPEHTAPSLSVTDFDNKVLYAPLGGRLRVAAMVDLVGNDASLDPVRLASLLRLAQRDMPGAADWSQALPWAGLRPATPSGAPVVGPAPATDLDGLWLNLGHGALGFTFAAGSAALLAAQMRQWRGAEAALPVALQDCDFSLAAAR